MCVCERERVDLCLANDSSFFGCGGVGPSGLEQ